MPGRRPVDWRPGWKGPYMNLLVQTLALIALFAMAPLTLLRDSLQSGWSPAPLVIEGDAITRLATSSPEATSQVVAGEGIYSREADGTWTRTGDSPDAGSIVVAADDPRLLLSGEHPPCLRGGATAPLQRSEDGGATWDTVSGVSELRPLAIWSESGIALGATCSGMMLSTDSGVTWSDLAGIEPGYEITAFATVASEGSEEESGGPAVLFGMTSEGGTSRLYRLDLHDPTAPELSEPLLEYWAVGGLAARGETYVLAAADGVWVSDNAGADWQRSAEGLEEVVLEEDPNQAGLPADVEPGSFGLLSVAFLTQDEDALVVGSADGLYSTESPDASWTLLGGTSGEIEQLSVVPDSGSILYAHDDTVFEIADFAVGGHMEGGPQEGTVEPAEEATAQSTID